MSEKEPKEQDWKLSKTARKEIQEVVEATLKAGLDSLNSRPSSSEPQKKPTEQTHEEHKHWTAEELFEKEKTCPGCKPELDKIRAQGKAELEKALKERASLNYECAECGTGVNEKDEKCPTCGGTKPRRRF